MWDLPQFFRPTNADPSVKACPVKEYSTRGGISAKALRSVSAIYLYTSAPAESKLLRHSKQRRLERKNVRLSRFRCSLHIMAGQSRNYSPVLSHHFVYVAQC
jgi:hypothetical protein